jgi:hypothetical protein
MVNSQRPSSSPSLGSRIWAILDTDWGEGREPPETIPCAFAQVPYLKFISVYIAGIEKDNTHQTDFFGDGMMSSALNWIIFSPPIFVTSPLELDASQTDAAIIETAYGIHAAQIEFLVVGQQQVV